MIREATLSSSATYRFSLRRDWEYGKGEVVFVMLNPSTADGVKDDPTIRKCVGFAQRWGYQSLEVVNLFALRATNPKALLRAENPTGGDAADAFLLSIRTRDLIVAAWGSWVPFGRADWFRSRFRGVKISCLGLTRNDEPYHPLYQPYSRTLMNYPGCAA